MSDQWHIKRTVTPQTAAQYHWDLAYQCLLKWALSSHETNPSQEKETQNASSDLCSSVDTTSDSESDH